MTESFGLREVFRKLEQDQQVDWYKAVLVDLFQRAHALDRLAECIRSSAPVDADDPGVAAALAVADQPVPDLPEPVSSDGVPD